MFFSGEKSENLYGIVLGRSIICMFFSGPESVKLYSIVLGRSILCSFSVLKVSNFMALFLEDTLPLYVLFHS
jgi:hypothetical protein